MGELDLGFVRDLYCDRGGVGYPPEILLPVILFGRSQGVFGSAELQEACRYDERYKFLARGHRPDDRTFDRFLVRIAPVMDELFKRVVRKSKGSERATASEVSLDGCRVSGSCSFWSIRSGEPSDPDARLQNSHGRKMVGYNLQAAIDPKDDVIVSATVISEPLDCNAMPEVLSAMRSQMDVLPAAVVADAGFETHESIELLERAGLDTCFAYKEALTQFVREDADGKLVCPAGRELTARFTNDKGNGDYVAYGPSCKGCALKAQCGFYKKRIYVPKGVDPGARFRNRDRPHSAQYHGALKRRRKVEKVFGQLKRNDGFGGFLRRGLAKVRVDFLIWYCSYNLRKAAGKLLSLILGLMPLSPPLFYTRTTRTRSQVGPGALAA